ncbi:MAG: hypothetical protein WD296_07485 [Acidimicrobiia bacterium]
MRKGLIAVIVAGALFAVGAFAATFSLTAEDVSSGADAVTACGTNATVRWHIDDSNAVLVTTTVASNFQITAADVSAPGCGSAQFRLAIQGTSEVLCAGTLSAGVLNNILLSSCTPPGNINVNNVTGAALLIGDQTIALQTSP